MIQSMTGYNKISFDYAEKNITIEIKSLNSKYIDISTRIPSVYKEKELEIRDKIRKHLNRGKIEFSIYVDLYNGNTSNEINKDVFVSYYNQLKEISEESGIPLNGNVMEVISKFPDIMKQEKEKIKDEEWNLILDKINESLLELVDFRKDEGKSLKQDVEKSNNKILNLLEYLSEFEDARMDNIKDRLKQNLEKIKDKTDYDENRFEQELIFYLDKYDINEEKVRLKNHCEYFSETIDKYDMPGKKLGFIAQEMGREINTLGSKANDSEIQKIVVQMKEELDKIKEQLLNIL